MRYDATPRSLPTAARGGQLSRTKWLFAVSSLARGPGDGARVRSSRARRRRPTARTRASSRRHPPSCHRSSPFPVAPAPRLRFSKFSRTHARALRARRTKRGTRFRARLPRWRGARRFLAICLSTDNGETTTTTTDLRSFDSCSINRPLRGDFVLAPFRSGAA